MDDARLRIVPAHRRGGMTLMEAMATVALSALMMTPLVALIKVSHATWEGVNGAAASRTAVESTLRELSRQLSDCQRLVSLSGADVGRGTLTVVAADGSSHQWLLRPDGELCLWHDNVESLWATGLDEFRVVGIQGDGVSETSVPGLASSVRISVGATLAGTDRRYAMSRFVRLHKLPTSLVDPLGEVVGGNGNGNGNANGNGNGNGNGWGNRGNRGNNGNGRGNRGNTGNGWGNRGNNGWGNRGNNGWGNQGNNGNGRGNQGNNGNGWGNRGNNGNGWGNRGNRGNNGNGRGNRGNNGWGNQGNNGNGWGNGSESEENDSDNSNRRGRNGRRSDN